MRIMVGLRIRPGTVSPARDEGSKGTALLTGQDFQQRGEQNSITQVSLEIGDPRIRLLEVEVHPGRESLQELNDQRAKTGR